jgi:hypothetical protein
MKMMNKQQQEEWYQLKKDYWSQYQRDCLVSKIMQSYDQVQVAKKKMVETGLHPVFSVSNEEFNAVHAARLISDYEIEILNDLSTNPQSYLQWNKVRLELITSLGILKKYDVEFNAYFSLLITKNLLVPATKREQLDVFRFQISDWGIKVDLLAQELLKKEVEEWDDHRGIPSLYRWSEI